MAIEEHLSEAKKRMASTVEAFKAESGRVRTGRASASLINSVKVDYYGTMTPMNQLATINVPEPQLIVVQPYDRGALANIEKAIQAAELGLNPSNDGKVIRVPVPPLTEERRKELAKIAHKYAEDARVSVRNVRRDGMDTLKRMEKAGDISADEHRQRGDEVQKLTDEMITTIGDKMEHKEQDILQV